MKRIIFIGILVVLSSLTGSPYLLENPEADALDFDVTGAIKVSSAEVNNEEEILVIDLEEVKEPISGPGIEQFFNGKNSLEQSETRKTEKNSNLQEKMTRIRTKIKCVEKILRKAVIKTHLVGGRIAGLQLNGLDEITEAKTLLLKSGDIILAVNGQTLSSKRKAYDIFKKARNRPNMLIDLLQDGKAKKLLFEL